MKNEIPQFPMRALSGLTTANTNARIYDKAKTRISLRSDTDGASLPKVTHVSIGPSATHDAEIGGRPPTHPPALFWTESSHSRLSLIDREQKRVDADSKSYY